jgi:hypothetical protein
LVPLAFALGVAALRHIHLSSGGGTSRHVCFAAALVSVVGAGVCGYFVVVVLLGIAGIEID